MTVSFDGAAWKLAAGPSKGLPGGAWSLEGVLEASSLALSSSSAALDGGGLT
mgnify:CR=1 FL=1